MRYFLSGLVLSFLFIFTASAHAEMNVCFSPKGGCQELVIKEIRSARKSIDVAMYEFTSKEIAQSLVEAKGRGVKIKITLDSAQIKDHNSKSKYLMKKGVNIKFHMGPGLLHDKFAIIDDEEVLTGSYNWTVNADKKNIENLLIVTDKEIAQKYTKQFKHLWSQSGEGASKEMLSGE